MSDEFFSRIVYDHKIVTIERVINVCAIYGGDHTELLAKTLDRVFRLQPKYAKDVANMAAIILQVRNFIPVIE